jgi:SAM-dependent methyltransferase
MKEYYYDKLFNIKTGGDQEGFSNSLHYHRYEATPYSALEELFIHYRLNGSDHIVDFGCGKGRLNFYIHHLFKATVVGVEMNETYYQNAIKNRSSYLKKTNNGKDKILFYCCLAEEYQIDSLDNRFYFFNPFSLQIFRKTINNILLSVEKFERDIDLILYYPSEEYVFFLENYTTFELKVEIKLPQLYEHDPNERFLVYRLKY